MDNSDPIQTFLEETTDQQSGYLDFKIGVEPIKALRYGFNSFKWMDVEINVMNSYTDFHPAYANEAAELKRRCFLSTPETTHNYFMEVRMKNYLIQMFVKVYSVYMRTPVKVLRVYRTGYDLQKEVGKQKLLVDRLVLHKLSKEY